MSASTDITSGGFRYRLAVLGANKVGKTCIIRRYLNDSFSERYKETKDDIYSRDFEVRGCPLPLDIHDTNYKYPEIRKIALMSASAFLVVFSLDDADSFTIASEILKEIIYRRKSDLANLPIVIAGNKTDSTIGHRKVYPSSVQSCQHELHLLDQSTYLETSAKENINIAHIFQALLDLSGFPERQREAAENSEPHENGGSIISNFLAPAAIPRRQSSMRSRKGRFAGNERIDMARSPARCGNRLERTSADGGGGNNLNILDAPSDDKDDNPFTRHGSLVRQTRRLSLKVKKFVEFSVGAEHDEANEPECKIS